MGDRIPGATPTMLSVKDTDGNEYACPEGALLDPNVVREEEKAQCSLTKEAVH